jgi:uncharacterized protein (TIGR03435 family)
MTHRTTLTAISVLAVASPLMIALAPHLRAQSKPERETFDVASIKPLTPGNNRPGRPQLMPNGRFTSTDSVSVVIAAALNLPLNRTNLEVRLTGLPKWAESPEGVFDIQATATIPPGLSDKARDEHMRAMLQSLLADRFKMTYHRESKEMPVFALVVAKGGPKLQKASVDEKDCPGPEVRAAEAATLRPGDTPTACHSISGGQGRGLHARAADLTDVINYLENWTADRPLIDKTGVKGLYRFDTKGWSPVQVASTAPAPGTKTEDGTDAADIPTLFQVFEQLGLKIESQKAKVDVYVIDHLEKPTGN